LLLQLGGNQHEKYSAENACTGEKAHRLVIINSATMFFIFSPVN
jgi:hypothetical protein